MTQPAAPQYSAYASPPKPPLPRRARRGAFIAGAVSFSVLSLGWTLLAAAVAIALVGGMFLWVAQLIRRGGAGDAEEEAFLDFLDTFDVSAVAPFLVIGGIAGLVLMVLAPFLSRWILGSHRVNQPWAVTWAATGIAVVAAWIISSVLSVMLQFAVPLAFTMPDPVGAGIGVAVASGFGAIVLTATIGLLSWWWMAHVMRSREVHDE